MNVSSGRTVSGWLVAAAVDAAGVIGCESPLICRVKRLVTVRSKSSGRLVPPRIVAMRSRRCDSPKLKYCLFESTSNLLLKVDNFSKLGFLL